MNDAAQLAQAAGNTDWCKLKLTVNKDVMPEITRDTFFSLLSTKLIIY